MAVDTVESHNWWMEAGSTNVVLLYNTENSIDGVIEKQVTLKVYDNRKND